MFFHKRSAILVALLAGLLVSSSYAGRAAFFYFLPQKPQRHAARRTHAPAALHRPLGRTADADRRHAETQMVFGVDVDGLQPGQAASWTSPPSAIRFAACATCRRASTTCRRCCIVRDVPSRRRPDGEAADGSRRRPALEPRARQPL